MMASPQAGIDPRVLYNTLEHTYSPDPVIRKAAEQEIKVSSNARPGALLIPLLQIVSAADASRHVKQAGSITLKNLIKAKWDPRLPGNSLATAAAANPESVFSEAEKEQARVQLLEVLMREEDSSLKKLLVESVKEVATSDYPDKWPAFLPTIMGNIQTGVVLKVQNALLALRQLLKRFEYKAAGQREPIHNIIEQVFPLLQELMVSLMPNTSEEASAVIKLILKCFWSATQFQLPLLHDPSKCDFTTWLQLIGATLQRSTEGQPLEVSERPKYEGWKAKKWACQLLNRYFTRYGNPHYAQDTNLEFAKMFSTSIAPVLLEQIMHMLALRPRGEYCTDRVVHSCVSFVNSAIELSNLYKLLKPHLEFLLLQIVFPLLCLTDEDLQLFETEPHEFMHRMTDPVLDFLDPKMPAVNLIVDLVKYRPSDTLPCLLGFVNEILSTYASAAPEHRDYRRKDGAFVALGAIHETLKKKKQYSSSLEGLIVQHIIPEFTSEVGFMRRRACATMQYFNDIRFEDRNNLAECLKAVVRALHDKYLPVQVEAATAIKYMLEVTDSSMDAMLMPILPDILNTYFSIMADISNDMVIQGLEALFIKFGDHMQEHAAAVIEKLAHSFIEYAKEGFDDDNHAMAAGQCLEAILTVLERVSSQQSLFAALEAHLLPLLHTVLSKGDDYSEYFEHSLEIIAYMTYYSAEISLNMWTLFPLLFKAFEDWACDYAGNLKGPVDNYITRGNAVFLTGASPEGVPYLQLVLTMATSVLSDKRQPEEECKAIYQLLTCVLHNCPAHSLDASGALQAIVDLVLLRVGSSDQCSDPLKTAITEAIASCFHYSAAGTFAALEARGATQPLLMNVFKTISSEETAPLTSPCRKMLCLALCSFLTVPLQQLPGIVQQNMGLVLAHTVGLLQRITADREAAAAADAEAIQQAAAESGSDAPRTIQSVEAVQPDEEFDEDQDIAVAADTAYLKQLRTMGSSSGAATTVASHDPNGERDSPSDADHEDNEDALSYDEWDEESDECDDSDEYESPVDSIDAVLHFYAAYRAAYMREPEAFAAVQASLSPQAQQGCQHMLAAAEDRQKLAAAIAAQQQHSRSGSSGFHFGSI